jgi:hypothetical protein
METIGYSHGNSRRPGTDGPLVSAYAALYSRVVRVTAALENPLRPYHDSSPSNGYTVDETPAMGALGMLDKD